MPLFDGSDQQLPYLPLPARSGQLQVAFTHIHNTMSSSLLHPPSHLPPATAVRHSREAPNILDKSPGAISTSVLQSVLSTSETQELWAVYENLLLSCLRTGDDKSAHECLGRLVNRFGNENERIMALKGLLKEATAADNAALELVLQEYEQLLQENPSNIVSICWCASGLAGTDA